MIRVTLRNEKEVCIQGAKVAVFKQHTQQRHGMDEVIAVVLEVKDSARYDASVLASFMADDVLFFEDIGGEDADDS